MNAEEHNKLMKKTYDKMTPEQREKVEKAKEKMKAVWGFYRCEECPGDSAPSMPGQKED